MANIATTTKINTSVETLVKTLIAGDKAADSTWIETVRSRERNRAAIESSTAKDVAEALHKAVVTTLAEKYKYDQGEVERILAAAKFKPSSVQQYWSQISSAEKLTGTRSKIVGREVHFEVDGGTIRFLKRTDATIHNAVAKKAKSGEKHETIKNGVVEVWGLQTQADGSRTVSVVSTRTAPAVSPQSGSSGSNTPARSPEEEISERFATASRNLVRSLKSVDGNIRQLSADEHRTAATTLKALAQALQEQANALDEPGLKAVIAAMKAVREVPQIKVLVTPTK